MTTYVALLRGVNVGGVIVKMDALKSLMEDCGFVNVRTLLASGNVIFDVERKTTEVKLEKEIESKLKEKYKRDILVLVRSQEYIKKLVEKNPFKGVKVTKNTRLYVTFTPEKELFNHIEITPTKNTTDLMENVEKKAGTKVTTRNWNTVVKIAKK